jgi:branched-chain amino acid transport system permease protein
MTHLAQLLVGGVSLGAVYALLALGFVVIFRATEVVNFAHPALLMVGAYFTARFKTVDDLPFAVAVLLGIGITVLLAALIQRFLVQRMSGQSVIAVSIMTIGVDVVIHTEITRRLGVDILPIGDPWQNGVVQIGALTIPQTRLVALIVGIVVMGAFFAWFRFSDWGVAMRASAEDSGTAALMGIRRNRVAAIAWIIAGALAAIAGMALTMFPAPGLEPATAAVALRAFPAAIIGGLDSPGGAVVGGVLVGVTEVLAQGYGSELGFLGLGFHTVMPYLVMVVVLLVRPTGLFGTRELHRV